MKLKYLPLYLFLCSCTLDDTPGCAYVPAPAVGNETPELTPSHVCGRRLDADTLEVDRALLSRLYFDDGGLASIRFNDAVFYVDRNGKSARTLYFDNGPDYFVEGMARTERKGKIGFIDKHLDIVVEPAYDFATPFHDGVSEVCNGCVREYHGEHWLMVSGVWGRIDARGRLLSPLRPRSE